jgi:tripartite-type tricarboxylate transporter receptor subunit TctC
MKSILKIGVALASLVATSVTAIAADWTPPGPIKLMIAFRAGGGADTQARLIAEGLEAKLGWKFIPEQVTGKGGVNMLNALKDQPNDGTVIGMGVTETLGYNLVAAKTGMTPNDFTGIATTAGFQMGIVSRTDKGWKSMADLVAAAKDGQEIRLGGMSPKLADLAYLLEKSQGVKFNYVSYQGGKGVLDAINAGDVDAGFVAGIQAKGVKSGDLVELASALSVPLSMTPDAPTLADLGVPYNADGFFVFIGPAGMPLEARDALADAIESVVTNPDSKAAGIINKAFGGAQVIKGDALQKQLNDDHNGATRLMAEVEK